MSIAETPLDGLEVGIASRGLYPRLPQAQKA